MMFRRSRLAELEPAQQALAQGRYEVAFALLEDAARRPLGRTAQGQYWLHLAAVYALYADEGAENGLPALRKAVACDANLADHPLYQALFWEFAAYRGGGIGDIKRGLRAVPEDGEPIAAYHAASALLAVGAPKSAAKRLEALPTDRLPVYLVWRHASLLGQCREALGDWEAAAASFSQAVERCPGPDREPERLSLAGALLELGRIDEALAALERVDEAQLQQEERSVQRYLLGRAHLERGNPNRAIELLREAETFADGDESDQAYNVSLALGQAWAALGRFGEASAAFDAALVLAPADQRAFTQHEAAYALIESERMAEADALLSEVVSDPSYAHRAEALADLADVRLKSGDFDGAERLAEQALEMGATASACLCLGNIAYEYFRLDEAASWFEQAVSASTAGDAIWVSAHQLLADVYAQYNDARADRVLHYAEAALEFTDVGSDWYLPLRRYALAARRALGGFDRLLN